MKHNEIIGYEQKITIDKLGELQARVDTGAKTSSIHADDIEVNGKKVSFSHDGKKITCPFVGYKVIKNPNGKEERPICLLKINLNGTKKNIRVTLTDRSHMNFPFILGRNALKDVVILPEK